MYGFPDFKAQEEKRKKDASLSMTQKPKKKKTADLSHGNDSTTDSFETPHGKSSSVMTDKFLNSDEFMQTKQEIGRSKTLKARDSKLGKKSSGSGQPQDDKDCIIF